MTTIDLGGVVALELALAAPERLAAVVLSDATPARGWPPDSALVSGFERTLARRLAAAEDGGMAAVARSILDYEAEPRVAKDPGPSERLIARWTDVPLTGFIGGSHALLERRDRTADVATLEGAAVVARRRAGAAAGGDHAGERALAARPPGAGAALRRSLRLAAPAAVGRCGQRLPRRDNPRRCDRIADSIPHMLEPRALALRTSLLLDAGAGAPPTETAADAVALDLALPTARGHDAARKAVAAATRTLADAGRDVHARVSAARSGELDADLLASVGTPLTAVVLAGTEIPQDVRDADVGIRRHEMRLGIEPGTVRLIAEIDSAAGLSAVAAILKAVDRHSAVALNTDGLDSDLRLAGAATPALDHAMWDLALAAAAARLPWTVTAPAATPDDRARLAARAHEFGASGVTVTAETEVRGLNALFTPAAEAIAEARAAVAAARARGRAREDIDRRALRRARTLLARVEAIERRERT
jgi:citrate lyase subunit beta/citryl-CoA lyase